MTHTVIETYDGSTAFRKDCRFIKGDFYIKNKQCFLINGTWYRANSGFIVFDNEKQEWVVLKDNPSLMKGIVGYDNNSNEVILGHYTPNPYSNITVELANGSQYNCINYALLPSNVFVEDPQRMVFKHISRKNTIARNTIPNNVFSNHNYPLALPYCMKHYDTDLYNLFRDNALKSNVSHPSTRIASYVNCIGNHSFGFEFETCKGKIPNYKILSSGLLPLRDGSITGIEFATIPLSDVVGIGILENACNNLHRYTIFSENESLHLHIGNIPTSKKSIGYLYTICCILEKEIYAMFPEWYIQTSKFKPRGRDYNMPLRKELVAMTPEETFDNLSFYLSAGKKYQGFGANHPSDPEGQHKWSINERY